MADYVTLLGAEQVQSAGNTIASAAHEMSRAASTIDGAFHQHNQRMEDWLDQAQATLDENKTVEALRGMVAGLASLAERLAGQLAAQDPDFAEVPAVDHAPQGLTEVEALQLELEQARGALNMVEMSYATANTNWRAERQHNLRLLEAAQPFIKAFLEDTESCTGARGRVEIEDFKGLAEAANFMHDGDPDARYISAITELVDALQPFSDEVEAWGKMVPDSHRALCTEPGSDVALEGSETKFCVGDLRRAKDLLQRHRGYAQPCEPITFVYKNHRGETAQRTVVPKAIWFGSTQWHPKKKWFLSALDTEKSAHRDFALADIDFRAQIEPLVPRHDQPEQPA